MSSNNFRFSSVEDIINAYPDIMKQVLEKYKLKGCYLTNGGYCSYKLDTPSGCNTSTKDFKKMNCNCNCFLFPLNLEFALNNSIYNLLTNVQSTEFSLNKQTIVFTVKKDKGNISNLDLNETQSEDVQMISIQEVNVQKSMADLSYKTIQDILEQAKSNKEMFSCPINQKFIAMYEEYGKDELNNKVNESITSTVRSMTINNQTLTVSLDNVDFKSLKENLSQKDIVKTIIKNIVTVSLGKVNESVIAKKYDNIVKSINSYCYHPNLWLAIGLPIFFILLFSILFYLYHIGRLKI